MTNFIQINKTNISVYMSTFYENVYEYVYIVCDYSFNYCPIHYQMVYFYFPLLFTLIKRRKDKKYSHKLKVVNNTTVNYILISIKLFLKKPYFIVISLFFKRFYLFIKIIFFKKFYPHLTLRLENFKNMFQVITWKPVFKKVSYFGIFSYIRTKWYKNK